VRFLNNYDPGRKPEAVERDWLNTIVDRSFTGRVQPKVLRATKAGTADEHDVRVVVDGRIGREDWLVHVFA
jgi:hypothetical protein